jgi:hypothetical protein
MPDKTIKIKEIQELLTLENGFLHLKKKPSKMGEDRIFWIPREFIKNGLVDPDAEYHLYLLKVKPGKPTSEPEQKTIERPDHW